MYLDGFLVCHKSKANLVKWLFKKCRKWRYSRGSHISQEIRFISIYYPVPNSIYQTFLPHLSQIGVFESLPLPGFLVATLPYEIFRKMSEKVQQIKKLLMSAEHSANYQRSFIWFKTAGKWNTAIFD